MLRALKNLLKGDMIVENLENTEGTKDKTRINRAPGKYALCSSNSQ